MQKTRNSARFNMPAKFNLFIFPVALLALLAFMVPQGMAQQITGTLSGTVADRSGAIIPGAQVVLKNEASGDVRSVKADGSGRFVITAIQPASYSINITAAGFTPWQENDIVMNQGDARTIPNIQLQVGNVSSQVEVIAGGAAVVPTDTAEISTSLNEKMIDSFPLQGRDAGELMKIMPGMALNNGGGQGSSFNDRIVGSNNGPVGAYSSNGTQPNGTMAYMLDGANLVDPGNFGTQIANINQDMVGSIKFLMSDYGAEYAKGPSIFQAFSKSGGQQFHGEAYLYTHNSALNAIDAYTKSQGGTNAAQSYYYMGGNVGGPVLLPFIKWNHDRKKLFFWGGYEYMKQQPAGSIINYNVPNAAQLSGDFSNTGVDPLAVKQWPKFYDTLATSQLPAGGTPTSFPIEDMDPNIPGILKLYPATNETPTAANGYSNYRYANTSPQNRWEATGKLDYAISDNTKLTGSYTYQKEADLAPISIWWATPNTLPYPSPGASKTVTYVILTNLTHVFNPTTTNEVVFTWSHFVNPYALANPKAVDRTANGFNVPGLFGNTTSQIPNFEPDYCCSEQLASLNYYPMSTGSFGGIKQVPAFYDNFTKVLGNHTLKVGFYWDDSRNSQNNNAPDNGTYAFQTYGQNSTTNLVADMMLGRVNQYSQQNVDIPSNTQFHQVSGYAQDSWRVKPRFTANIGLRLDHIGQWYAIGSNPGFQVFNLAKYNANPTATNPGLLWHAIDTSVPLSGFVTPTFYYAPRVGLAYDLFGTGKTVLRGGFAVYRYQATSETASAENGPLGSFGYGTTTPFNGYTNVTTFTPPASVEQNGSNVYAMQQGDARAPWTADYNFTVSQALPWRSVFEASYVGNHSAEEYLDGSNSNIGNLNNNAVGAFFNPDPILGKLVSPSSPCETGTIDGNQPLSCVGQTTPTFKSQDYRPLQSYQNVMLLSHAAYSYYNSLQVTFTKQSGPFTFLANYTFSKVLGIRDGGSNNGPGNGSGVDPFVLRNNYGPLAYDHTHILNLTYNWSLPSPIHGSNLGMKLAGGAVNGWKLSGYTTYQSGAPLQLSTGGSLNTSYASGLTVPTVAHPNLPNNGIMLANGLVATSINPSSYFGTDAYKVLVPALTCDPTKGLAKGQYFNPKCFTTPAYGTQGAINMPYMRNPAYFDSDLGLYKDFHFTSSRYIQFRASATNWLNHPLRQFGLAGNGDQSLNFQLSTPATCAGCVDSNGKALNVISESPTNVNTSTTGTPAFKNGSRFVTLAAKFYF
ncbi:MAG TPA: carboxypeptidase regulatory-like domain-containing protein [Acidobacteriaceae bacterium]